MRDGIDRFCEVGLHTEQPRHTKLIAYTAANPRPVPVADLRFEGGGVVTGNERAKRASIEGVWAYGRNLSVCEKDVGQGVS